MSQSLSNILVHATFSTLQRRPVLLPEVQPELFAYMATVMKNDKCPTVIVGGHVDHVHVLFRLGSTKDLATAIREVKTASSSWIRPKAAHLKDFAWQSGYAAFSVSPREVGGVRTYIASQAEHHRKELFTEEVLRMLNENEMAYDERYLWD